MTLNITNPTPIQVDGKDLPNTETFTYLGSTVRNDGGAGNDIMNARKLSLSFWCDKLTVLLGLSLSSSNILIHITE
jgi:hypothetical protein